MEYLKKHLQHARKNLLANHQYYLDSRLRFTIWNHINRRLHDPDKGCIEAEMAELRHCKRYKRRLKWWIERTAHLLTLIQERRILDARHFRNSGYIN